MLNRVNTNLFICLVQFYLFISPQINKLAADIIDYYYYYHAIFLSKVHFMIIFHMLNESRTQIIRSISTIRMNNAHIY